MTIRKTSDQGFDDFRRARLRVQAKLGPQAPATGFENNALRELEQAEEREVRDQQLTREVHDFFAAATRQAAAIVDRVARDAEREAGAKVEQEMESFLIDSLARMNNFVLTVLQQRRGQIAETQMEPRIGNLLGSSLDQFRHAGTADIGDKHIGKNPFAIALDDVQREFRAIVASSEPAGMVDEDAAADAAAAEAPEVEPAAKLPPAPAPVTRTTAVSSPEAAAAPEGVDELERFKAALKALVRQGVMTREEARAAWQARLQALGVAG